MSAERTRIDQSEQEGDLAAWAAVVAAIRPGATAGRSATVATTIRPAAVGSARGTAGGVLGVGVFDAPLNERLLAGELHAILLVDEDDLDQHGVADLANVVSRCRRSPRTAR